MIDRSKLDDLFLRHGCADFRWISAGEIRVAQWVRFKCQFGCTSYGKKGTCPPNVPSVEECQRMIAEYGDAVIFHFEKRVAKSEERGHWSREEHLKLCGIERETFLAGYYKAFLIAFDSCRLCEECRVGRAECKNPKLARPGADAMGIDVFATARGAGYPIQVLRDYDEAMNRYAFLLVE
jgi:predicted metal-binding protein